MDFGDRKFRILKFIIDDYISTGLPVGSGKISKKPSISVSSATIRNDMANLENLGLLLQPHTSAGRIPSDLGYRMYVDFLKSSESTSLRVIDSKTKSLLFTNQSQIEDIIKSALSILSKLTGLCSIISLPLFKKSRLKNMKLIKINEMKVMLIMVSDTGAVKNITLPISYVPQNILDVIAGSMLEMFVDTQIEEINIKSIYSIRDMLSDYAPIIDYLIPILRDSLKEIEDYEIYVDGVNSIFELNEFSDIVRARKFLDLVENKDLLYNVLKDAKDDMLVRIGKENKFNDMHNLSLIASPYKFNGVNEGRIGVIGPTRMSYEDVMRDVDSVSEALSYVFSGIKL